MMDKLKEYIEMAKESFAQNRTATIVVLVILAAFLVSAIVRGDSIVMDSGQVIDVPDWADYCEYDETYCEKGWLPDGSFPFADIRAAFIKKLNEYIPPDMTGCIGLSLGGSPVYPCFRVTYE